MSDVTVAPSGGSAPSAAPVNEVPVNPNPTSSPTPVGSQAPDKPVGPDFKGSEHRPPSRREAIQAAFDKATRQQDANERRTTAQKSANTTQKHAEPAQAKPAEAKPGHNKPPEPTEAEKPKLNLKKRPDEQEAHEPQPRDRGRFAPKAQGEANGQAANDVAAQGSVRNAAQPAQQVRTLPETAPYREPPPRFSEGGKAEWHATPESIRGDIHRMHQEFAQAHQHYRADHEAMNEIRPFHQMASEQGTSLARALNNYVGIEQKLRSDVIGGLDVIVNNLNLRTPDGERIGLRDIAYHVLSQSPEQLKQIQQGNAQTAASQQIGALYQEINGLKQGLHQWQTAQKFNYTRSQVDQFADDGRHPRFDELGPLIEQELRYGFDLDTAYRRAELLHPATHAPQTRTASAQTRNTESRNMDRSISGAPDTGSRSNGASRRQGPPPGRREAIANAIKRVNGSL